MDWFLPLILDKPWLLILAGLAFIAVMFSFKPLLIWMYGRHVDEVSHDQEPSPAADADDAP